MARKTVRTSESVGSAGAVLFSLAKGCKIKAGLWISAANLIMLRLRPVGNLLSLCSYSQWALNYAGSRGIPNSKWLLIILVLT